jgi:hypothetical protein
MGAEIRPGQVWRYNDNSPLAGERRTIKSVDAAWVSFTNGMCVRKEFWENVTLVSDATEPPRPWRPGDSAVAANLGRREWRRR